MYSVPVSYRADERAVTVMSRRTRVWWRNLTDDRPVQLHLRGQVRSGVALVEERDDDIIGQALLARRWASQANFASVPRKVS